MLSLILFSTRNPASVSDSKRDLTVEKHRRELQLVQQFHAASMILLHERVS